VGLIVGQVPGGVRVGRGIASSFPMSSGTTRSDGGAQLEKVKLFGRGGNPFLKPKSFA